MKIRYLLLAILGPPWVTMILLIVLETTPSNWHEERTPFVSQLLLFEVCSLIIGAPQILWALIGGTTLPRSSFIGGLAAAHVLMVVAVLGLYPALHNRECWSGESLVFEIVFLYWPFSLAVIITGALAGYIVHRTRLKRPKTPRAG